jgi:hypothetical protein
VTLWRFVLADGGVGLVAAGGMAEAERAAGDKGEVVGVRAASPEDVAWVRRMGGWVPNLERGASRERVRAG